MRTLPFGAKAAVYHFNRVARFIWAIGCYLHVPWANYMQCTALADNALSGNWLRFEVATCCNLYAPPFCLVVPSALPSRSCLFVLATRFATSAFSLLCFVKDGFDLQTGLCLVRMCTLVFEDPNPSHSDGDFFVLFAIYFCVNKPFFF